MFWLRTETGTVSGIVAPTARPGGIRLAVHYLERYRLRALGLAGAVVVEAALWTVSPLILAKFVRDVASAPAEALTQSAALYAAVGVMTALVTLGGGWLALDVAQRTTSDLRVDLLSRMLASRSQLPSSFTVGDLYERIDGDTVVLQRYFSTFVFDILSTSLLSVSIVAVALLTDWRLGGIVALGGLLSLISAIIAQRIANKPLERERSAKTLIVGYAIERLSMREDLRGVGAENHTLEQLEDPVRALRRAMLYGGMGVRLAGGAFNLVASFAICGVLILGGLMLGAEMTTLSVLFLVYQYLNILTGVLFRLGLKMSDLGPALGCLKRVNTLLHAERTSDDEGDELTEARPSIVLSSVSFRYPRSEGAVHGVSLRVPAGRAMALIGASGSGKSTILKLLQGAVRADEGRLLLGEQPLGELSATALTRAVGTVHQESFVFQDTLRSNLTLLCSEKSDDEIVSCVRSVGLGPWFDSLSNGLDTRLEPDGTNLSRGQAQLIGIARVLLRDVRVVLLDEVTSKLDPAVSRVVQRAAARLLAGRTGIVVTHSAPLLDLVDFVAVMRAGSLVWSGPRALLPAQYQNLVK